MNNKTILYVEDNEDHYYILKLTLKKIGFPVELVRVKSGDEALDYLYCRREFSQRLPEKPDIILLDLKITGIDGFNLIKKIKTMPDLMTIPVVVLTSSEDPSDIEEAYKSHANSYVPKSIDASMFRKQIETLVYYWTQINHPVEEQL